MSSASAILIVIIGGNLDFFRMVLLLKKATLLSHILGLSSIVIASETRQTRKIAHYHWFATLRSQLRWDEIRRFKPQKNFCNVAAKKIGLRKQNQNEFGDREILNYGSKKNLPPF